MISGHTFLSHIVFSNVWAQIINRLSFSGIHIANFRGSELLDGYILM